MKRGEYREGVTRQGDKVKFNISTMAQINHAVNVTTTDAIEWIHHVSTSSITSVVFIFVRDV